MPVRITWKNPDLVKERLRQLDALVQGEILADGTRLTTEHILREFLSPELFAYEPFSSEGYEVLLTLCDVKQLRESAAVPDEGSWPLYITKTTFGPVTIHCRPERTSQVGALIKVCQVADMFKTEEAFKAFKNKVQEVNTRFSSLAEHYDEQLAREKLSQEAALVDSLV